MRAVCQRVTRARVVVAGETVGAIERGLVVLLGVARDDGAATAERLAGKVARLRIFEDDDGKFARSLIDVGGAALVVSQFTLVADTRRGNRPSFDGAAAPADAERLYVQFCSELASAGVEVQRGLFGAQMAVELVNDGPVTIVLDLA
jgi:D-aminoacyl-tRNA deacylase